MARSIRFASLFALLIIALMCTPSTKAEKHFPHHRTGDIPAMVQHNTKVSVEKDTQERMTRAVQDPTDNPNTPATESIVVSTNTLSSTSYTTATEGFWPTGKSFPESPVGRDFGGRSIIWFGRDVAWDKIKIIINVTSDITNTTPIVWAENRQDDKDLWGGWETNVTPIGPNTYTVSFYNPGDFVQKVPHMYEGLFISSGADVWFDKSMSTHVVVSINDESVSYDATASVSADPSGVIFPELGAEWLNNQIVPWQAQPTQPPVVCLTECTPVPPQVLNTPARTIYIPLAQAQN